MSTHVACSKRRYPTRLDAQIALADTHRRGKGSSAQAQTRAETAVYRCSRCGGWHLKAAL